MVIMIWSNTGPTWVERMATWIILILKDMDLYTLLHNSKRTSGVYISVWNLFETRYLFFSFGKVYLHMCTITMRNAMCFDCVFKGCWFFLKYFTCQKRNNLYILEWLSPKSSLWLVEYATFGGQIHMCLCQIIGSLHQSHFFLGQLHLLEKSNFLLVFFFNSQATSPGF